MKKVISHLGKVGAGLERIKERVGGKELGTTGINRLSLLFPS